MQFNTLIIQAVL